MECGEGRACGRDIRVCVKGTICGKGHQRSVLWLWRMVGQEAILYREGHSHREKKVDALAGSYRDERYHGSRVGMLMRVGQGGRTKADKGRT